MLTGNGALHEELQRLKANGVDHIYLDDATVALLKAQVPAASVTSVKSETVITAEIAEPPQALAQKASEKPKTTLPEKYSALPEPPAPLQIPEGSQVEQLQWLKKVVHGCETCQAHLSEHGKIVFGAGNENADIFFCGEAPGADEETSGEPFVGKAGALLAKIIQAMGLNRESVYIANILKWRPEHDKPYGNRPPNEDEMNFCLPYVRAQIEIIQPKVIVALGNTAVSGFLGVDPERRMGSSRGTWHSFGDTPLMITFHPSYLLRNDTMKTKRMVWEDMLKVMEKVGLPITEKQQGFFLKK